MIPLTMATILEENKCRISEESEDEDEDEQYENDYDNTVKIHQFKLGRHLFPPYLYMWQRIAKT